MSSPVPGAGSHKQIAICSLLDTDQMSPTKCRHRFRLPGRCAAFHM